MRSLWAAAILGLLILVGGVVALRLLEPSAPPVAAALARYVPTEPPRPMPELAFEDGEGRARTFADFRGRAVVLNLWATWCAPCVRELPSLDRLQAELGGADFEVVALSLDRGGRESIVPFYREHGVASLATYIDPAASAMRVLKIGGLPTTIVVDRDGREVGRVVGEADWASDAAKDLVQRLAAAR